MLPQLLQRVAKHRRGVSSLRFAKVSQTRCPLQCRQSKGPPLLSFSLLVEFPLGATASDETGLRSTTGCHPPASHAGGMSNLLARAKVMEADLTKANKFNNFTVRCLAA